MAAYQRGRNFARAYGIMVLGIQADLIGEITGFADPSRLSLLGLRQADWPPDQDG